MGTSASSNGPGAGVSYDPPWLDDIDIPNQDESSKQSITEPLLDIAPKARFGNARRGMGEYARTGDRDSLRKALGHYSKTGMGGSRNLANRMATSTKVAANLFQTFQALRDDASFPLAQILADLRTKGANATQIIDVVVDSVCPYGGSLDEISSKDSGTAALSEFMDKNPEADIGNLTDDQIWLLTGMFLGNETFSRIQLDIGQAFENQDVSGVDRIIRMNDMREFMQSEISQKLNNLRASKGNTFNLEKMFRETVKNTFEVFEVEV